MASLSFLLGMVPGTEKVETADDQLRADFQSYKEFEIPKLKLLNKESYMTNNMYIKLYVSNWSNSNLRNVVYGISPMDIYQTASLQN